jgi:DivIVA domain-containing protein
MARTAIPAQVFPYYRSPSSIRDEVFTQRMRGLDADEVDEYLNLLADQVETCERERVELFEEIDQLREQVARLEGADPTQNGHAAVPQAALVLSQAQQVADELVEEAVARAQQLIMAAHQQQREILEAAHQAAEAAAREAAHLSARNFSTYVSASAPEVEYARRFTEVAQVQLRSVLEALCEQVEQLGQVSRLWQQSPLPSYGVLDEPVAVESRRHARTDAIPAQLSYGFDGAPR